MLTQETIEKIDAQLQADVLPNALAEGLGISRATMEKHLLKQGYEIEYIPAKRRLRRVQRAELAEAS